MVQLDLMDIRLNDVAVQQEKGGDGADDDREIYKQQAQLQSSVAVELTVEFQLVVHCDAMAVVNTVVVVVASYLPTCR